MKYTNNYNLKKPDGNDAVQIEDFNNNAEIIDFELAKRVLKGELTEGLNLKIDNDKKSDSVILDSSDRIATSKAVKVAYDKGIEALEKGNRNETQLADNSKQMNDLKTSVDNGKNGVYSAIVGKKITPASKDFSALVAGVNAIKQGQGNANENDVIGGKTFTNADGILRTGNIPIRGSEEFPAWRRAVVDVIPPSSGRAHFSIPLGAYVNPNAQQSNNVGIFADDVNYTSANILSGKSIFGLVGTATVESLGGKRYASGKTMTISGYITVTGLTFQPSRLYVSVGGTQLYSSISTVSTADFQGSTSQSRMNFIATANGFSAHVSYHGYSSEDAYWEVWS